MTIRHCAGIRGVCEGTLVVYDKHLNLVLREVTEWYTPFRTVANGGITVHKKARRRRERRALESIRIKGPSGQETREGGQDRERAGQETREGGRERERAGQETREGGQDRERTEMKRDGVSTEKEVEAKEGQSTSQNGEKNR